MLDFKPREFIFESYQSITSLYKDSGFSIVYHCQSYLEISIGGDIEATSLTRNVSQTLRHTKAVSVT